MQKKIVNALQEHSLKIFYGLLAYMPFHIFISTVIGANIGGLALMKVLKDIVLVFGFCSIMLASFHQSWFKEWLKNKLVLVIVLYAALTLLLALVRPTDTDAEVLGVTYNLRFLIFFLYAWLLVKTFPKRNILQSSVLISLVAGTAVALFGVVQYVLLPNDALTHLGFVRSNGVLPAFFIDDKPDLERVMSTLRDPNSLGSYLIIVMSLAMAWRQKSAKRAKLIWSGVSLMAGLCLLLTFSRSALLGLVVALACAAALVGRSHVKLSRKQFRVGLVVLAVAAIGFLASAFALRNSYFVQNVIFHADQSTSLEDPNQLRVRFLRESVVKIAHNPAGLGPGRAGLASIRNNVQGTQLNENYYLQVATEVGVLGLTLFLAILILVAVRLYRATGDSAYATALLAAFAGLALTNILVHIWSNEAVAYTWWGLAGLVMTTRTKSKMATNR
jgi:O-antigen ligase